MTVKIGLTLGFLLLALSLPTAFSQQASAPPELVVESGHSSNISALDFDPTGRWLVTGGYDFTVRIWERASGRELRRMSGHSGAVTAVAISPDGACIASGDDKSIRLWETRSGRLLRSFPVESGQIHALAFSPDGTLLAAAGDSLRVWRTADWSALWHHEYDLNLDLVFTPDSRQIAVINSSKLRLLDAATGEELRSVPTGDVTTLLAAHPPAGLIAFSVKNVDYVWDLASGKVRTIGSHVTGDNYPHVYGIAIDPRGRWLASVGDDPRLKIWDLATGKQTVDRELDTHGIETLRASPDGRILAAGGQDPLVRQWDAASGAPLAEIGGSTDSISSLGFSPDGRWLMLATTDMSLRAIGPGGSFETVKVWDTRSGDTPLTLETPAPTAHAAFFPDSHSLLVNDGYADFRWNPGAHTVDLLFRPQNGSLALAVSPDGQHAAGTPATGGGQIWDVVSKRAVCSASTQGYNWAAAFSQDGRRLALGGIRGELRLFDAGTCQPLATLKPAIPQDVYIAIPVIFGIAFSPDGRHLAATNNLAATVWSTQGWKQEFVAPAGGSLAVAFSPDSKLLAVGGSTIALWDVATGKQTRMLDDNAYWVDHVAFSPDGQWLLSGGRDSQVRLWRVADGSLAATLVPLRGHGQWLVVTPEGFFDGSPGAWQSVLWRFASTFDVAPVEVFFREFYHPGLLGDVLAGKRLTTTTNLGALDRRQPIVKVSLAAGQAADAAVAARRVMVKVEVQEAPADAGHAAGSGAEDVRLFRNGSLVHIWHGDVLRGKKQATLEAEVTMVAGENKLTAYAFNHDNIKSSDAALTVTGAESLKRPGTAYILAVGVNRYADADFNLRYAASDAEDFAAEIERAQQKLGRYAKVEVTTLEDEQATKANLLGALRHLAAVAQPEDAVFLYYAGHGTAAGARFYLIPHDLGYAGSRDQLDDAAVKDVLAHSVSDLDLDQAFETIDAGELVLVIDACRSGQALQADDPRQGPMNSKGLAQLAYEKGMYILTASQGYQAALEASSYGHGLLTYALVEEGLKSGKADTEPKDGEVTLREWLDYASQEVPQLELELMQAARSRGMDVTIVEGEQKIEQVEQRSLQRPRLFYRREPEAAPFVVAKP